MNNLSSYCGLVDAKIRASDKDLPVTNNYFSIKVWKLKDNTINAETKAEPEAEEKEGFVKVNKVYQHDSIQIKKWLVGNK